MNFKLCSVILYSNKAVKKAFESELQFTIIWLKLSPAQPVVINMQKKENYLPPKNVAHQHVGTPSDPNGSYIFNCS